MSVGTRHVRLMTEREHYERMARFFDALQQRMVAHAPVRYALDRDGAMYIAEKLREKAKECEAVADE